MTLWNYMKKQMLNYPQQQVSENDAIMTYEELIIHSELFAKSIWQEKCCAVYCYSEFASAIAVLGCIAAGVTVVPISARYDSDHCNKILHAISPSCVITDLDGELGLYQITDSEFKTPRKRPAFIISKFGNRSVPNCVMLSEENIMASVDNISNCLASKSTDAILITRSLSHCAVLIGELLVALSKGLKVVFYSEDYVAEEILKLLVNNKITVVFGTPSMYIALSKAIHHGEGELIRHLVISGECLTIEDGHAIRSKFPKAKIYHMYGLTEAASMVSYMPPAYFDRTPNCVGMPFESVQIRITNKKGNTVKKGCIGTLWVKGSNLMLGYYNEPKLTSETLRSGWLNTNDIARINNDGWLEILTGTDYMKSAHEKNVGDSQKEKLNNYEK